ncbi:MAG: quinone oxidoreductase [Alphaproteobacteria bacterium]|jgi:NADPH:quinone reductase|nr:quinone oxidoreductase [Alphaproteobacteria bacterium]
MTHAIRIHETGGPEVMRWEEFDLAGPGPGEAQISHTAVGLNYIDVYHRTGLYPLASMPGIIGMEGAGVVNAVGDGVTNVKPGDRVAYAAAPPGAYTEARNIEATQLVTLPDDISDELGAAMMLQGMTVEYLVRRTYAVKAGETVLVHAAAGGVGLMLCQWLDHIGATVIGTVGSSEKATLASAHGCHHPINYREGDWVAQVKELTGGEGVPVVYDSVAKDTFAGSLDCLAIRGMMVNFGQASGVYDEFEVNMLSSKSLFLTRPALFHYNRTRDDLLESAGALFDVVGKGAVKIEINQRYPLSEAAQAHRDLEARKTTGSTVLLT